MTPHEHKAHIAAQIHSSYNTDSGIGELTKAEVLDLCKGGKAAMVGETKNWGGKEYIKTANGWRPKTDARHKEVEEHKKNNPSYAFSDEELRGHAKAASEQGLKKHIKESRDPKMRTAAQEELKRRGIEEAGKPEKKTKEVDPAKQKAKEEFAARNSWWQQYKQYNLNTYPVDVPQKDVKVNIEGDVDSHAVLTWKDPKTGAVKNAYTKEFLQRNAAVKWERTSAITSDQVNSIKSGANELLSSADPKVAMAAAIISIIAETGLRRGDPVKFEKTGNRGVSTLSAENVTIKGNTAFFSFTGKSYKHNTAQTEDPTLVKYLTKLKKEREGEKFLFNTSDSVIDSTFDKVGGEGLKIKDMRTYVACDTARKILFEDPSAPPPIPKDMNEKQQQTLIQNKLKKCYELVSQKLNNTPAMAKTAYIHPNIIDSWIKRLDVSFEIKKSEDADGGMEIPTMEDIIKEYKPKKTTGKIQEADEEMCDEYNQPTWFEEEEEDSDV